MKINRLIDSVQGEKENVLTVIAEEFLYRNQKKKRIESTKRKANNDGISAFLLPSGSSNGLNTYVRFIEQFRPFGMIVIIDQVI